MLLYIFQISLPSKNNWYKFCLVSIYVFSIFSIWAMQTVLETLNNAWLCVTSSKFEIRRTSETICIFILYFIAQETKNSCVIFIVKRLYCKMSKYGEQIILIAIVNSHGYSATMKSWNQIRLIYCLVTVRRLKVNYKYADDMIYSKQAECIPYGRNYAIIIFVLSWKFNFLSFGLL